MKTLSLSLLVTTILSTAAITAHAAGTASAPGIYFYPSKAWTVGHAQTPTDCAIQSEFNNGFVLQFDGNAQSVQSLSVNFRQALFTQGRPYNVKLSVPGKISKTISAAAASPTMLTLPLQANPDLYKAARDNAVVDITIDDNAFRFYLVNFAPSAANFENCMAGKDMKDAPTPAPVPQAAPQPVTGAPAQAAAPMEQPREANARPALLQQQKQPPAVPASGATGIAPPPPNGRDVESIAMMNEAIAMEEQETKGQPGNPPIQEILPADPQPKVKEVAMAEPPKADAKPDALTPPQAPAEPGKPAYRKRMSEQLAEEMATNPGIARIENSPAGQDPLTQDAAVEPVKKDILVDPTKLPEAKLSHADTIALPPPGKAAPGTEPFSKPGEVIKTDAPKPVKTAAATSPTPSTTPAPFKKAAEPVIIQEATLPQEPITPAPQAQTATIQKLQSPAPIIRKETTKMDADFTGREDAIEPAGAEPFAQFAKNDPSRTGDLRADPEMLRKISDLETQITKLEKENVALNDELKTTVGGAEQENASIASENWNLERATMRYNEAERQIKRLGDQIQRERAQCGTEKKDMEAQLFDPQITSQQQMAKLAELEQKLAAAEQKLQDQQIRYEERIKILQAHSATQ